MCNGSKELSSHKLSWLRNTPPSKRDVLYLSQQLALQTHHKQLRNLVNSYSRNTLFPEMARKQSTLCASTRPWVTKVVKMSQPFSTAPNATHFTELAQVAGLTTNKQCSNAHKEWASLSEIDPSLEISNLDISTCTHQSLHDGSLIKWIISTNDTKFWYLCPWGWDILYNAQINIHLQPHVQLLLIIIMKWSAKCTSNC